jgi:hypothetical protein
VKLANRCLHLLLICVSLHTFDDCWCKPSCWRGDDAGGVSIHSSDLKITQLFNWAKRTALGYSHDGTDPVGYWYEAALPGREAFCMRDVSHQSIGAEILGLGNHNLNMMTKFVKNISAEKDWCSYWEINRYDRPAPVDYRSDKEFWYNLPANFDVMDACWRLYRWTGDQTYVRSEEFRNFYLRTLNEYIERWQLQPGLIMARRQFMNSPVPFDPKDPYHISRGIGSYAEDYDDLVLGSDLIAVAYRGMMSGSEIFRLTGETVLANDLSARAGAYKDILENGWWDVREGTFYGYRTADGSFHHDNIDGFLLTYGAVGDMSKVRAMIQHILSVDINIESKSYYPMILYGGGYDHQAREVLLVLGDARTKRREYPEVSFAVIEGIVCGMMGLSADASSNTVTTFSHVLPTDTIEVSNIPVLGQAVSLKHIGKISSSMKNLGTKPITWKVCFEGSRQTLVVDGRRRETVVSSDAMGRSCSYLAIDLQSGQAVTVQLER